MKISVLMAYWRRPQQLRVTLESYRHWYESWAEDLELVIIADTPTPEELSELTTILSDANAWGLAVRLRVVDRSATQLRNPGPLYNLAATLATAPVLALTNPENVHMGPVLNHALKKRQPGEYYVYACQEIAGGAPFERLLRVRLAGAETGECSSKGVWFQHSHYSNRGLHFMGILDAETYRTLGGFDPIYNDGHGYEDNDFIERILKAGIQVEAIDDPWVGHQMHDRSHWSPDLLRHNRDVFVARWGHHERTL